MSINRPALVQQLFEKSTLDDCSVEEVQAAARQYPYFSAIQFLLLKKLEGNTNAYAAQKDVATLHVYNPLQVDAWLQDPEPVTENMDLETPSSTNHGDFKKLDIDDVSTGEEIILDDAVIEKEKDVTETFTTEETPIEKLDIKEDETDEYIEENALDADNTDEETVTESEDQLFQKPMLNLTAPVSEKDLGLTFEPYHTVDYFASQGIKLSQQEGNDAFGKQLKSFTEWLKTMKKIPATASTQNTDGAGEKKVENLAAHSVQSADVVTESMAEVWVKQGNLQKAIEVYNKLSLQNPSKKPYFAAKIESLKKPN